MKNEMRMLAVPWRRCLILPALGVFLTGFIGIIIWLVLALGLWDEVWAEAGCLLSVCVGLALLTLACGVFGGYCMRKQHILYDDAQLFIGRPFHPYERLEWHELPQMEIKNQDFFLLYDRECVRRVTASADMTGYHDFYETAMTHCKSEYVASARDGSAFPIEYNAAAGEGVLRYRMGEYYVLLFCSLLVVGMILAGGAAFGESAQDMLSWFLSGENLETKLVAGGFLLISVSALLHAGTQKITYDWTQIEFQCFPRRRVCVNWRDVREVRYSAQERNRSITLYTRKKRYVIRERQFRRGFSELLLELRQKPPRNPLKT
ncbi:MAG: hypothetical protein NC337_05160 [Roseburia sp.]|nr:hypothetical protein [Roseburia sp.]